uniref:Uncharacterized protein n=1 Tax=Cucumis melo TaxID=3656 RepID=A0A9I9EE35_CUCME
MECQNLFSLASIGTEKFSSSYHIVLKHSDGSTLSYTNKHCGVKLHVYIFFCTLKFHADYKLVYAYINIKDFNAAKIRENVVQNLPLKKQPDPTRMWVGLDFATKLFVHLGSGGDYDPLPFSLHSPIVFYFLTTSSITHHLHTLHHAQLYPSSNLIRPSNDHIF